MKKLIEFQESNSDTPSVISRWTKPKNQFDDLILTPEYRDAKAKLLEGTSTLRVLPAIKDSEHWLLPIDALIYSGGQHAHPQSIKPNSRSVFDLARTWFKQHASKALYTRSAGKGFKLWTQPMAACWLLVTHDGRTDLKLLVASAFAGTKDRKPGLAYQLMEFVQKHRELLDPESMCELQITRSMPENSEYLETEFQLNQSDRSLNECIAELPAEQIAMVCPVEQTIRQFDQDEEWKLLEKAIGSQWTDKIRSSSQRKIT